MKFGNKSHNKEQNSPNAFLLFLCSVIFVSCLITCSQPVCFYDSSIVNDYLPSFVTSTAQWIVDILPFDKVLLLTVSQFALAFYGVYFAIYIVGRFMGAVQWIVGAVLAYAIILMLIGIIGVGDGLKDQLIGYIRQVLGYFLQYNYPIIPEEVLAQSQPTEPNQV